MGHRRFERQERFEPLGKGGQERLEAARVAIVGCGALGGVLAQTLTRAGVGTLVLIDRDVVEETNLHRQVLFEDRHADAGSAKVDAARETLARIGGPTRFEPHALHVDSENVLDLIEGADLVLDGTDNLATRYLLNDACVREHIPWVYAGVVAGGGLVMPIPVGGKPCLRCVFPSPAPAGLLPTCDTAGVLPPAVGAVASLQAGLGLRMLVQEGLEPALIQLDVWTGETRRLRVPGNADCPCCAGREFPFLEQDGPASTEVLCGRNAVQVRGDGHAPDFDALERNLTGIASELKRAGTFMRFQVEDASMTVFPDGRALVQGTEDSDRALALYDRYVGS
ncbi:MAG: molybdopterin/thiamine biosynthesis adenylyltransferase [Chlamydiales bacterium]|jgi:molybdopterin/thiamine biosynthesis adenylyltransferase